MARFLGGLGSVALIVGLATLGSSPRKTLPPFGFIAAEQGECVSGTTHLYAGAPLIQQSSTYKTPEQAFDAQTQYLEGSFRRRDISPTYVVFEKLVDGQPVAFVAVRNLPGQGWNVTESQEKTACGTKLEKGEFLG